MFVVVEDHWEFEEPADKQHRDYSGKDFDKKELKQTDAAAVNMQIFIQKHSRPSKFSRPLTPFTL